MGSLTVLRDRDSRGEQRALEGGNLWVASFEHPQEPQGGFGRCETEGEKCYPQVMQIPAEDPDSTDKCTEA